METATENTWPRKEEATAYLEKHKIIELFNNLTSQLIYNRPSNPKELMIEHLENLSKSRATRVNHPCLFDEGNIQSVYGMLDPTGQGHITTAQYTEAMNTLGIKDFDPKPAGSDVNRITMDTFFRMAKLGLAKASATFSDKK